MVWVCVVQPDEIDAAAQERWQWKEKTRAGTFIVGPLKLDACDSNGNHLSDAMDARLREKTGERLRVGSR
jgi:hypothetical protein